MYDNREVKQVSNNIFTEFVKANFFVVVALIISVLHGSGFYGFGNDFYAGYHLPNLQRGSVFDFLGFRIATLSIFGRHIGVYLTTFFIMYSLGFFIKNYCEALSKNKLHSAALVLIYGNAWPIFLTTSNAMRQGLSMAVLFMLASLLLSNNRLAIRHGVLLLIGIFLHKSFIPILFSMLAPIKFKKIYLLFLIAVGILIIMSSLFHFSFTGPRRSIGLDVTPILNIIATLVVVSLFYKSRLSQNFAKAIIGANLAYIVSLPFLDTWASERIGFSIFIPTLFYLLAFLKLKHIFLSIYAIGIGLIILTNYIGLHASFK